MAVDKFSSSLRCDVTVLDASLICMLVEAVCDLKVNLLEKMKIVSFATDIDSLAIEI